MFKVWPGAVLAASLLVSCGPSPQQALEDIESAPDPDRRVRAVEFLGSSDIPFYRRAAVKGLLDPAGEVRAAAQRALALIDDDEAGAELVEEMLRLEVPVEQARPLLKAYGAAARDAVIRHGGQLAGPEALTAAYLLEFPDGAALAAEVLLSTGVPEGASLFDGELRESLVPVLEPGIREMLGEAQADRKIAAMELAAAFGITAVAPELRSMLLADLGEDDSCIEPQGELAVRAGAAATLASFEDVEAVPLLVQAYNESYDLEQCAGGVREQEILDRLRGIETEGEGAGAGGDYHWLRERLLEALAAFGDRGLKAAAEGTRDIRAVCVVVEKTAPGAEALLRAYEVADSGDARECLIEEMAAADDPRITDALLDVLLEETAFPDEGTDYSREASAAMAALEPRAEQAADRLIEMVQEGPPQAAARALRLLAGAGAGEDATRLIMDGLASPHAIVRAAAAEGAGLAGDAAAVPPLKHLVALETDRTTLWAAMESLAILDPDQAAASIAQRLGSDTDDSLRSAMIYALGEMAHPAAVGALLAVVGESEPEIIWTASYLDNSAAEALVKIGEAARSAVEEAVRSGSGGKRRGALRALLELDAARAERYASQILDLAGARESSQETPVSADYRLAALALGACSTQTAVQRLLAESKDPPGSPHRSTVVEALAGTDQSLVEDYFAAALEAGDLEIVAAGYTFYLDRGYAGAETVMIDALRAHGTEDMAEDYLNRGDERLQRAAADWASEHGYTIGFQH